MFVCTEGNNTHERIFELIVNELSVAYPGHIMPTDNRDWIYITNGGWMGCGLVLHASATEFLALLGTAIHTSGHTGKNANAIYVATIMIFCISYKKYLHSYP